MCESVPWTEDGCLISYGPDPAVNYRRAATYVDKILKGANQPTYLSSSQRSLNW